MLLITKVEIGSDFEAWAESCISFLDNAPSWVRYPKEKLYTEPPLRMFACVKKSQLI